MRKKDQTKGVEILHRLFTANQISAEELFLLCRTDDDGSERHIVKDLTKPGGIAKSPYTPDESYNPFKNYNPKNEIPFNRTRIED
jgi:hypothetical protein